jgi:peptidyl-prolyl cis-trans isomerase SurA
LAQNELVLATFGDKQYTTKDAAASINPRRLSPATTPMQAISNDVERAVEMGLMNIEISTLEVKYPEYSNLINEYRDGMLLFEISNREVWEKASTDVKGLEKFFNKNKKNYKFDAPRFRGAVIQANSPENLVLIKEILAGQDFENYKSAIEANLPKDSVRTVRVEVGIFAQGDNAFVDKAAFGQGEGGKLRRGFVVSDVVGKVISAPESYKDVKGMVTNDYQKYLEEKWVKSLRKKYKVKVDKTVLKTVNNHE